MNGLLNGLQAYWKMDEASGNAIDVMGNYNLTPSGTVGSSTGKIGNARNFSDPNYLSNSSLTLSPTTWSWSVWFKANSFTSPNFILGKWSASVNNREFRIITPYDNVSLPTYRVSFGIQPSNFGSDSQIVSQDVSTGVWNHVVVVWRLANIQGLYVNGSSNYFEWIQAGYPGIDSSSNPFQVGGPAISANQFNFDGLIDEIGYWNKFLTATDVDALYNSGSGLAFSDFDFIPTPAKQSHPPLRVGGRLFGRAY